MSHNFKNVSILHYKRSVILVNKRPLADVICSAFWNSNCRLSRSYVQQIKRRKECQWVFDSTRLVPHIFSQLLLQKTAYNSTHHSDRGQPHSSGERLKESKFVNRGFSWFLHYEAEAEVHKWLTEVDAFLSFCSYCNRSKRHIPFLGKQHN